MRDLVFLYGAGASYGAGDILPERPPLGSTLFGELARVHPGSWGALPPEVRHAFEGLNFEAGMALLYEHYTTAIPRLLQEMAVYFIQFRPYSGRSCYCEVNRRLLASGLMDRTVFSTLNYDCVLEFSLSRLGLPMTYAPDGEGVPVLKLHGSCNWFSQGLKAGEGVRYTKGIVFEGGVEATATVEATIQAALVNQGLAPVMSLYMAGKLLQVSPSAVGAIQHDWQRRVAAAAIVACVGVRPWPEDHHIWDPIAETPAEVLFVGDKREFEEWRHQFRSGPCSYLGSHFSSTVLPLTQKVAAL